MNPLGETAPSTPVEGGCGDPLCAARAWFVWETPGDTGVTPPCDRCAGALATLMAQRQEGRLRAMQSVDCHLVDPL